MLNLSGIAKRYGGQIVLGDVTWGVPDGARVGLTGPNGAGKSTLLRIIAGDLEPDAGAVALPRGATVGYLPQHVLVRGVPVRAHELSAGWQMRVALAQLLLRRPDILLLDEPTNYLDLEARNWLEEFLAAYAGTIIMVAHDRYFLDVTVDHIAEVLHGRVTDYPMTYSRYLEERETRLELARQAYEGQKAEIERVEAFVHRFRYQASKAALVQRRVKQLEKIERLPPPDGHGRVLKIRLPEAPRSGRAVVELTGALKHYGDVRVYDGADVLIERGQRVALVGPNGAGKTTLLKLLAGVLPLDGGTRRLGHNVRLGYFAQHHAEMLGETHTVLAEAMGAARVEAARPV